MSRGRKQSVFPDSNGNLLCTTCKQYKDVSCFYIEKTIKRGYSYTCKPCGQIRCAIYGETIEGKDIKRRAYFKTKYSLSTEQINQMRADQEWMCAICHEFEEDLTRPLVVDHNHITGKNRKLLCYSCNNLLSTAKENVEILKSAIEYLKDNN